MDFINNQQGGVQQPNGPQIPQFNPPPLQPIPSTTPPQPQVPQQQPIQPQISQIPQPKKSNKLLFITIGVVVVIAILLIYYFLILPQSSQLVPIQLATSSFSASQGESMLFTVYNVQPGDTISFFPGNGQEINQTATQSSIQIPYTYNNPGNYLAFASEYRNGKLIFSSMVIPIKIISNVNNSEAQFISEPVISFNSSVAPNFNLGSYAYIFIGFLQPPSNSSTSILSYTLRFSNGTTESISANSSTMKPIINPIKIYLSNPGINPIELTITTRNSANGLEYNESYIQDILVNSSIEPFSLFKFTGNVPNPGIITVSENVPGGPYSFDPQIDYEDVGFEVIANIIGTLLEYNGSSVTSFIPYIASQVPSVSNGEITNNYTEYTFQIRNGLKFSNGDPLTAYDVWYSMIRNLLFVGGQPSTPDWILAQYLISNVSMGTPIVSSSNMNQAFNEIMNSVTYNNQTNTVTFHLIKSTSPALFFQAIADPLGTGILDAKWLQKVGNGITFTPQGFLNYENFANEGSYNLQVDYDPVASGPYEIKTYIPGQSIVLSPNPYYTGVPGIPRVNDTVIIYWVKDPQTAYDLFVSGQADIVDGLPSSYYPALKTLESQGTTEIYQFPTLSNYFFAFNLDVNTSMLKQLGSQYSIPYDYFANLYVRKAFTYAFNYTEFLNDIVGNAKYGFNFGNTYPDAIIAGLAYYTPPNELANVSYFNLSYARQLMLESGEYNTSVTFPIVISTGDTTDFDAAQMWALYLKEIDPNINAVPIYEPFSTIVGYMIPNENPFPIYLLGWSADYPYPSDFVNTIYLQGGTYPAPDGWSTSFLQSLNYTNQANMYQALNNAIMNADSATTPSAAAYYYKEVAQLAINLYMYLYTLQPNNFWVIKSYISPYENDISYQENPMIGGGGDGLYFWWNKA